MLHQKQAYLTNKYSKILHKEELKDWVSSNKELLTKIAITLKSWLISYDNGFFPNYESKTKRLNKIKSKLDILPLELLYTVASLGETTLANASISLGYKVENNPINAAKSGAEMLAICDGLGYFIIRPSNSFASKERYKIKCNLKIPDEIKEALNLSMYLPPKLIKSYTHRPEILGDKFNTHKGYLNNEAINILSSVSYKLDKNIISIDEPMPQTDDEVAKNTFKSYLQECKNLFKEYKDLDFYFDFAYDKRGRIYSKGYHINIQANEYHKASLKFAKYKKLNARGWYWLRIDLANHLGMDKENFSLRDKFIKENIKDMLANKDKWIEKAKDKLLFTSALLSYEESLKTGYSNHIVRLDATTSGAQLMSVISRDKKALKVFNVTSKKRYDYYTIVAKETYEKTKESTHIWGDNPDFKEIRDKIKKAIMVSFYNSIKKPAEIFGKGTLELMVFYKTLDRLSKGARKLQQQINDVADKAIESNFIAHCFSLPDNHIAYCPIINQVQARVEIAELDKKGYMNIVANANKLGKDKGSLSLAPNIIHAIDGWIVRMIAIMLAEQNCELSPIHDSFGVHANDCDILRKLYRSLLARLYREDIISDIVSDVLGMKIKIDRDEFDEETYTKILHNKAGHYIC